MGERVTWRGSKPMCSFCHNCDMETFIDGMRNCGGWALFCQTCWEIEGCGHLGMGCGQRYDRRTLLLLEGAPLYLQEGD